MALSVLPAEKKKFITLIHSTGWRTVVHTSQVSDVSLASRNSVSPFLRRRNCGEMIRVLKDRNFGKEFGIFFCGYHPDRQEMEWDGMGWDGGGCRWEVLHGVDSVGFPLNLCLSFKYFSWKISLPPRICVKNTGFRPKMGVPGSSFIDHLTRERRKADEQMVLAGILAIRNSKCSWLSPHKLVRRGILGLPTKCTSNPARPTPLAGHLEPSSWMG